MKVTHKSGFTLIEIMLVVSIVGLLAALAVPAAMRAAERGRLQVIYSNLRLLESAKEQWALERRVATGTPINDVSVLAEYINGGTIKDVVGEGYVPNSVGDACGAALPPGVSLGSYPAGGFITSLF